MDKQLTGGVMYFKITQMRRRGIALPWKEIHSIAPLEGDLYDSTNNAREFSCVPGLDDEDWAH